MSQNPSVAPTLNSTSLIAAGPAGDLEVLLDTPVADVITAITQVAVICHPHPLFGGTMNNKVVHILARAFNDLQAPAVRFNFRGVGKSAGRHDDGRGETDDVLAVLRWTSERWPGVPIWLAGFSFGAAMALKAALQAPALSYPVTRLITVAPAMRWLEQLADDAPACPWLVVQGDHDELVDAALVQRWAQSLSHPPQIRILAGAEHFFHGRLSELRETVKSWVSAE